MIKNYLKIAWRNLIGNKSYTFINITGLAVGMSACLLIFLIVQFETSFDNFHSQKDHIYRVTTTYRGNSSDGAVPFPTAEGLRNDYPQLKEVAAIFQNSGSHFNITDDKTQAIKKFKEDNTYYAEPQFFKEFDFEWLAGDKTSALSEPNSVVLTQREAGKFFGNWHNAIGKIIKYQNKTNLKVTGVLKNMPVNTDFPLQVVISYSSLREKGSDYQDSMTDWVSVYSDQFCFVVLPDNLTVKQFNEDLTSFVKRHKPAEYVSAGMKLQPLTEMHYDSGLDIFSHHPFSKQLIDAISLIGLFLLVVACVNFINLATAQAVNRSKEVGIRKVLGSNRRQLLLQFICETFLITFFAAALAIGIARITLPFVGSLLETTFNGAFIYGPAVLIFLFVLVAVVTLLSGLYPAMVLSGFKPVSALKNKLVARQSKGISLRSTLVVLQFCIAQVLVIGTIVIINQMDYFKNKPLGFVKDAVLTVPIPNDSLSLTSTNTLRNQLMAQPGVKNVSYSYGSPSDENNWHSDFIYNNSGKKTNFEANLKWADADYFNLYKLTFVAGQPYPQSDKVRGYVVNETLLKRLGVDHPKDAIGKYINLWNNKSLYAPVVGVVKDFNVVSLRHKMQPVIMASWKSTYQMINIKIQPLNITQTLAAVERLWNNAFPDHLYEYQFLDDKIAGFYKSEAQLSMLYKIFAGIAIFISCLGLYGLVSFMAVQRTKEVGIRKTLGASVGHIVYLFSKEFTLLILIAFAISAPIGWYAMNKWFLQGFIYKITVGPGIFILAIAISILIAWITVGYKSIKAALANPVKSLRSE